MKLVKTVTIDAVVQGRTIGILGQPWRATVTPAGDVYPWDDGEAVKWYVAADDRWHIPADEVAVRQRSIDGAPVLETRVRIPGGDVIQRVWVATGRLGSSALMMEFENDSPMAIAIAIDRQDLLVSRPVAVRSAAKEWPAPGLDIPREPTVIPVGHRTSVRAALVISGSAPEINIADFADWTAVARGWVSLSERASRFTIPDLRDSQRIDELIVVERTEIALNPASFSDAPDAAVRWLLEERELKRMDLKETDLVELSGAVETISRAAKRGRIAKSDALTGLKAAAYLLGMAQERALVDLRKVVAKIVGSKKTSLMAMLHTGSHESHMNLLVSEVENEFAEMSDDGVMTFLPGGMLPERLGVQFEVHGIAVGINHRVSFAVRWHGQNAAVIWEVSGSDDVELRSGVDATWSSTSASGEALWRVENVPETAFAISEDLSFS
ncbi:unannotated protein [freshwater metagenome]|uniref:Unannotated protein n=1 Tax=freshwater metagenome TaxID=449393 RepID=A0A6J7EY80_9ZZZZ